MKIQVPEQSQNKGNKYINACLYTMKEGNFLFLTEETATELLPLLLKEVSSLKEILNLIPHLLKRKLITSEKLYETIKNNFLVFQRKELKLAIKESEEPVVNRNNLKLNLTLLLGFIKDNLKKLGDNDRNPLYYFDRAEEIFLQNSWLGEIDIEKTLSNNQQEIIKEYNEQIELFILSTLKLSFEQFLTNKAKHKNYAILFYSHSNNKFKSSFCNLFKDFSYSFEKEESSTPFGFGEEYVNWKFVMVLMDETDLSFFSQSYLKRFIEGTESHVRVMGEAYKRNDRSLVLFTANHTIKEMFEKKKKTVPTSDFYFRIKEVNVNTDILKKLFFEFRSFMKYHQIPYPSDLNEIPSV